MVPPLDAIWWSTWGLPGQPIEYSEGEMLSSFFCMNWSWSRSPLFSSPLLQPPPSLLALLFFLSVLVLCWFFAVLAATSSLWCWAKTTCWPLWLSIMRVGASVQDGRKLNGKLRVWRLSVLICLCTCDFPSTVIDIHIASFLKGCSLSLKMLILVAGVCWWRAVFLCVHCSGHVSVCMCVCCCFPSPSG